MLSINELPLNSYFKNRDGNLCVYLGPEECGRVCTLAAVLIINSGISTMKVYMDLESKVHKVKLKIEEDND